MFAFFPRCLATQLIVMTISLSLNWTFKEDTNSTVSKFSWAYSQLPKELSWMPTRKIHCFLRCLSSSKWCVHLESFNEKPSHHYLCVTAEEVSYPGRNQNEPGLCDSHLRSQPFSLFNGNDRRCILCIYFFLPYSDSNNNKWNLWATSYFKTYLNPAPIIKTP